MNIFSLLLLIAAALLVIALSLYAWYLWRQVWTIQKRKAEADRAQQERLAGDLRILAGSLLDEQVPLIEGAIRIKVLLDNFSSSLTGSEECRVFHELYDATAHIPTHADWKALSKAERRIHEHHFRELELQYKGEARRAAQWLIDEGLQAEAAPQEASSLQQAGR